MFGVRFRAKGLGFRGFEIKGFGGYRYRINMNLELPSHAFLTKAPQKICFAISGCGPRGGERKNQVGVWGSTK